MQAFPHHYAATAQAASDSLVSITTTDCTPIISAPPAEFGGPGDQWSPETLFVASVADCFILSFKAIASASRFEWLNLECAANGVLDKVERSIQFTEIHLSATITLAEGGDREKAMKLLEKAEQTCLISNSLSAKVHLESQVLIG
ncbi:OsmC family protein [Halioxenophilus aromaticivorans]|uniref:Osmotically inducible protein OsmC n=1 Tax=Halioxenophilus aromaticivorans TaxID=1306992 RepID=A0AAV3U9N7_9ALTE